MEKKVGHVVGFLADASVMDRKGEISLIVSVMPRSQ